jgi:ADP-ribose pyrophosphatase YjhB (NUDIX family)
MKLLRTFNRENVSETEAGTWKRRRAVRTVVFDQDNNVALIHVGKHRYYDLPGGGVEPEETWEQGCIRECKEEIGCDIEIVGEIGRTLEYRKQHERINESFCFVGKVVGKKGLPSLEEEELASEMETIWVPMDKALELFHTMDIPEHLYDRYVVERSVVFLNAMET